MLSLNLLPSSLQYQDQVMLGLLLHRLQLQWCYVRAPKYLLDRTYHGCELERELQRAHHDEQ